MRIWSAKPSSASPWIDGLRFDPAHARRGHVESWFLKANDPVERRAVWLKWTVWAPQHEPRRAVAEVWAIAFDAARGHVAVKTQVPFERASFPPGELGATIDGCSLSSTAARGRVESGGRSVAYDLAIDAREAPLVHYPARWMYGRGFPRQKLVSPVPSALLSGTLDVQGARWSVEGWPGMIGHNWGEANSEAYAWGHCNSWEGGDDVVFEGFSGRVRAGGVLLPPSTGLCLRHHGTSYMLSGFASLVTNRGTISPRRWRFRGESQRASIKGEMWADTEDFVGLFYPNPDGTVCHCLNSKLAHAELTVRVEGRAPRTLRSQRAALEVATRDPHHGVRMYV
jgi:hypothetical protein